jgi:hypothetical protein
LEKLFDDARANANEIIRTYFAIVKEESSDASQVIPFLNEKAVHLLSAEVDDILKKNKLEAYRYLLVANDFLELEDITDDLLNGHVLASAAPPNKIRKLKDCLGVAGATSTTDPSSVQQSPATTIATSNTPVTPIQLHTTPQLIQQQEVIISDAQVIHRGEHRGSSRLLIQLSHLCTDTTLVDGVILHKLPLKILSTFDGASSIVKRFSFGEPDRSAGRTSKTILLMGATGSGKTTWINAMVNYVLGVEWEDPFRFVLIDEEVRGASQAHSQTQGVTAYDLHFHDGFRIPFSLTIVDTPGFGDTGGIERDNEITSAVQKFFEHQNGIQVINNMTNWKD